MSSSASCSTPLEPCNHPLDTYNFPKRSFGKKNIVQKSCRTEWFKTWSWLHYIEDKDTVLCHVCMRQPVRGN